MWFQVLTASIKMAVFWEISTVITLMIQAVSTSENICYYHPDFTAQRPRRRVIFNVAISNIPMEIQTPAQFL
jgi:hypothetical protein